MNWLENVLKNAVKEFLHETIGDAVKGTINAATLTKNAVQSVAVAVEGTQG